MLDLRNLRVPRRAMAAFRNAVARRRQGKPAAKEAR